MSKNPTLTALSSNNLLSIVGWFTILAPLVFFFLAVQHSAIVFLFGIIVNSSLTSLGFTTKLYSSTISGRRTTTRALSP